MASNNKSWVSPLVKQCYVTTGVSINLLSHGLVTGFCTALLPQLKRTQQIPIDEESASWIASIFGIGFILGTLIVPAVMNNYGRRIVSIASAAMMVSGWIIITAATSVPALLIGRFVQGLSLGLTAFAGSVLVGEYTSPKYRGALLTTLSACISLAILLSHALGSFMPWRRIALVNAALAFLDLLISIFSPESPSFLATKGRYDECRRIFHWLRGYEEEEELENMIKTDIKRKEERASHGYEGLMDFIRKNIDHFFMTLKKKEVYRSIIVMIHLYGISQWAGSVTFDVYANEIIHEIVGDEVSYSIIVMSLGVQRVVSNTGGILIIKKLRRRLVLILTISLNILCFLVTALYLYLKSNDLMINRPSIGIILMHVHIFTISTGAVNLPTIIVGEIFPIEHRAICGMICMLFFSINMTINVKIAPGLFSSIGVCGAYLIDVCLVAYFLSVSLIMLPETKDRTLQEIEEEFRGEPFSIELLVEKEQLQRQKLKTVNDNKDVIKELAV